METLTHLRDKLPPEHLIVLTTIFAALVVYIIIAFIKGDLWIQRNKQGKLRIYNTGYENRQFNSKLL